MKEHKVFTYGILRGTDRDKEAILMDYRKFYRAHASIVEDPGCFVVGEVHDVNDEELAHWDMIEGVDQDYYHRFKVNVLNPDGTTDETWAYQQVVDKEEEDD